MLRGVYGMPRIVRDKKGMLKNGTNHTVPKIGKETRKIVMPGKSLKSMREDIIVIKESGMVVGKMIEVVIVVGAVVAGKHLIVVTGLAISLKTRKDKRHSRDGLTSPMGITKQ